MRLLFVHAGPIFQDGDNYYEYSYHGLYERYSYIASDIAFIIRVQPLSKENKGTLVPREIEIINVPNINSLSGKIKNSRAVKKTIENEIKNCDCAILRASSYSKVARKYAKKYHKPYIYECVGCVWDSLWNHSIRGKLLAPYAFVREKINISRQKYVYYVTDQFLQKRYPTRGKSIGCSNVVIDQVPQDVLKERLKKISDFKKRGKIVLGTAAATDVRYKGQEYVIKAMADLVKEGYDIVYKLAGGNRLKSSFLKNLAMHYGVSDRVVFCGSLDADEIMNFYDSLDLYIQPSKQEGLPRSVIEAMSRGVPTLGSNIAGIPELLPEGCLFRKGCVGEIKRVFKKIINSDLKQMAIRNFEKAQCYRIDVLNEKREKFYDEFMKDNGLV